MDIVIVGRNELAKPGNYGYSKAGVSSVGHLNTDASIVDTNGESLTVDTSTRTLTTTTYPHHEIHAGSSYLVHDSQDLANGATYDYSFVVPNTTKWPHMVVEATSKAEMQIDIYEAPTLPAIGTPLTAYNKNRNSTNTATTIVYSTPTVTATGTVNPLEDIFGAGKTEGGASRGLEEFIWKQNTQYLVRFLNRTTSANWLSMHVNFYEHTNKV